MATATVSDVVDRTMRDDAFLDAFRADPAAALEEYDLDDEEVTALVDGDESRVREALGEASLDWTVSVVIVVIP